MFAAAADMARAVRLRRINAVDLVVAHLDRIAAVNPALHAVVQTCADDALARAARLDAELAAGHDAGPLAGVPFTVKDWIETSGVVCTAGFEKWRDHVPVSDATVVARMRTAGAILLGKTNVMVDNLVYGRTENPYRPGYSPAGSSSGEAAIIAAGGSPVGLGSDSGGSIRQPAHNCGIAGLKPSTGRIPLTGHLPAINPLADPRTTIGPLARYVEDLALLLPILAGPDGRDPSAIPASLGDWRAVRLADLRVAWFARCADAEPDPACEEAAAAAARALAQAGARVVNRVPPRMDEVYPITRDYWRRPESESWDEWEADGRFELSAEQVERHLFQWDRFRRSLLAFMADHDVVVTPAAELPARPHGEPEGRITYTLAFSLTGYPCVVVRAGTTSDGLPVGAQIVAAPWRDDVALAAAREIERALGGYQRPPLPA